jgi:hypothetical protein
LGVSRRVRGMKVPLIWRLPTAQKVPPGTSVVPLRALSPGPVTGLGANDQTAAQAEPSKACITPYAVVGLGGADAPHSAWPVL